MAEAKVTKRIPIAGGNWKCNSSRASIKALLDSFNAAPAEAYGGVEVVLFPPLIYADYTRLLLTSAPISVGAQDCWPKSGAYTGEVTAEMMADCGLKWTIVGHSERRHGLGDGVKGVTKEGDALLALKAGAGFDAGLSVIFCVGETEQQQAEGKTDEVVCAQLEVLKTAVGEDASKWARCVVAYEPVWAIGTGKTATPEMANATCGVIRKWLADNASADVGAAMRIMYGGSVKPANSEALAAQPDIDGFLVGGASLKPMFVEVITSLTGKL